MFLMAMASMVNVLWRYEVKVVDVDTLMPFLELSFEVAGLGQRTEVIS